MLARANAATASLPVLPLVKVETNWDVITGTLSSGKSTLIADIAAVRPDLCVIGDIGREVIARGLGWRGDGGEQIELKSILGTQYFENTVWSEQWNSHVAKDPAQQSLFDFALPCHIAFARACGLDSSLLESRSGLYRYRNVFLLDPLAYVKDEARDWEAELRLRIYDQLFAAYREFGFEPIRFPVLRREQRRDFVIDLIDASRR